jgi:lipoprotein-anchoring transpeptidase ErfK/SrfK
MLEVQLALARNGISSGSLDGKLGSQTRAALRAFQQRAGLPVSGQADPATRAVLAESMEEPVEQTYVVSTNDLAQLGLVGTTWLAKSQQSRLGYETLLEALAERAHAHPAVVRSLNPGINWTNLTPGTPVRLPNVQYPPVRSKAAFVRIRLGDKTLSVYDAATNLIAHFPCSIARQVEKRPVGQLMVEKIASNPNYRFDPEVFPESPEAREIGRKLMIPPGPNNPVGTAWIGLNRPGYGIHGTPRPEEVGRTESHGCFRLANWNAEYLLQLVSVGTPVFVEP